MHYLCDEQNGWQPDLDDIRAKITPRTKAIVVINPNNPTGAVYSREVLEGIVEIARENSLLLLSDEIYDRILFDDADAHPDGHRSPPTCSCLTFNGLSKTYRVAGFRSGWLVITGPKEHAAGFLEGITLLASTRLCPNVPAQHAVQAALSGVQSIDALIAPAGRLHEQRDVAWEGLEAIPGVSLRQAARARSTPSPASTPRSTRSATTRSSSTTSSSPSTSSSCRGRASTGRRPTTCASSRCPRPAC